MPTPLLRALTDRERTRTSNRRLGGLLAFVAGGMNAGGFLLLSRYTSHMTGIVSGAADSTPRTRRASSLTSASSSDVGLTLASAGRLHRACEQMATGWRLLSGLLAAFLIGGIVGAFAFKLVGALAAVPLGAGLLLLAMPSLLRDLRSA